MLKLWIFMEAVRCDAAVFLNNISAQKQTLTEAGLHEYETGENALVLSKMCVQVFVCSSRLAHPSSHKGVGFHYPRGVMTGLKQPMRRQGVDLCGDLCLHECDVSVLSPLVGLLQADHDVLIGGSSAVKTGNRRGC